MVKFHIMWMFLHSFLWIILFFFYFLFLSESQEIFNLGFSGNYEGKSSVESSWVNSSPKSDFPWFFFCIFRFRFSSMSSPEIQLEMKKKFSKFHVAFFSKTTFFLSICPVSSLKVSLLLCFPPFFSIISGVKKAKVNLLRRRTLASSSTSNF